MRVEIGVRSNQWENTAQLPEYSRGAALSDGPARRPSPPRPASLRQASMPAGSPLDILALDGELEGGPGNHIT